VGPRAVRRRERLHAQVLHARALRLQMAGALVHASGCRARRHATGAAAAGPAAWRCSSARGGGGQVRHLRPLRTAAGTHSTGGRCRGPWWPQMHARAAPAAALPESRFEICPPRSQARTPLTLAKGSADGPLPKPTSAGPGPPGPWKRQWDSAAAAAAEAPWGWWGGPVFAPAPAAAAPPPGRENSLSGQNSSQLRSPASAASGAPGSSPTPAFAGCCCSIDGAAATLVRQLPRQI
jgi:hypothetical protein